MDPSEGEEKGRGDPRVPLARKGPRGRGRCRRQGRWPLTTAQLPRSTKRSALALVEGQTVL